MIWITENAVEFPIIEFVRNLEIDASQVSFEMFNLLSSGYRIRLDSFNSEEEIL